MIDIRAEDEKVEAENRRLLTGEQQAAIKWFEEKGGHANYDPQHGLTLFYHRFRRDEATVSPAGLQRFDCLRDSINWISLGETQIDPDDLKIVGAWDQIESLFLDETAINDDSLRHLSSLTKLKTLGLQNTAIRGEGFRHLHDLQNLETLYLGGTQVDDESMKHIAGITSLKELSISNTAVTIAGLGHLSKMPNLRDVTISGTAIEYMEYQLIGIYLPANVERARDEREHYEKHGELPYTQEEWERGY